MSLQNHHLHYHFDFSPKILEQSLKRMVKWRKDTKVNGVKTGWQIGVDRDIPEAKYSRYWRKKIFSTSSINIKTLYNIPFFYIFAMKYLAQLNTVPTASQASQGSIPHQGNEL